MLLAAVALAVLVLALRVLVVRVLALRVLADLVPAVLALQALAVPVAVVLPVEFPVSRHPRWGLFRQPSGDRTVTRCAWSNG